MNVGATNDLASVIHENLEGHCVSNILSNPNKVTAPLPQIQREVRIVNFAVDGIPPSESDERTDVTKKFLVPFLDQRDD
jgi:tetrahydromethanopterin S-methyltransferase subunit E